MDNKDFRIVVAELKVLKGGVVLDEKITEEQFIWIIDYLRDCFEKGKQKMVVSECGEGEQEKLQSDLCGDDTVLHKYIVILRNLFQAVRFLLL